jgi:serine/threonine-protein kinase
MAEANWQKVREVFDAALQQLPGERQHYIHEACGDDKGLLAEVESLFSSLDKSDEFLETPAVAHVADMIESPRKSLAPGTRFGRYEIVRRIGAGGMGAVYLAQDEQLDRRVGLKILNEEFSGTEANLKRFVREAKAASALNHPNILVIHEVGASETAHYIVSEFIEGRTLRDILDHSRMSLGTVLDVSIQIADALSAAHGAHLVHRDIKPENVMVRPDGYVKVLDFGLAKPVEQGKKSFIGLEDARAGNTTAQGVILGTVNYMSPEQARGAEVDARTDIWSLGVVLYEMVTGRAPFAGETPSHTIVSVLESEPPPLSHDAEAHAELNRIITKALRKNREERYQTAEDLALDLKSLKREVAEVEARPKRPAPPGVNGRGVTTKSGARVAVETGPEAAARRADIVPARPTSSAEYLVNRVARHRRGAALAAAAVLAFAAAVAYFFYSARGGEAIDSVAVLPFVNASGDPGAEYLAEGISDTIINSLSRLPRLRVISLNTVLRYKGKQIDPQQVGRELNVRAVLMGRMTQRGDSLVISTELVDVRDNRRLWGGQYSRKPSDILVVQDEIAREMAAGLRLRLTGEEQKQLAKQYTGDSEAYLQYSLGRYYFRDLTGGKAGFEKSIEYYEQAIKMDPNYALAYTGLAGSYMVLGQRGFWTPEDARKKTRWATQRALELDDTLAEAHTFLGALKFKDWDWAGAEKELKRALELDPKSLQAVVGYMSFLVDAGRTEEALPFAKRAEELDEKRAGGFVPANVAYVYFHARQYDAAIELYLKSVESSPKNAHLHFFLGEAYVAKGRFEEGVAELQKAVALENAPERWDRLPMLAYAYAAAGRRGEALKILDEQKRLARQRYISPYNFAIIYTGLGDKDRAFEHLNKAYEESAGGLSHFPVRPMFDTLRSDPRYTELLRRMNLAP